MDNIQGIKDMEKIIEIDLFDKYDLTEKYNDKHLSSDFPVFININKRRCNMERSIINWWMGSNMGNDRHRTIF